MNINYDEIITKANDRKLLLQSLTTQLEKTPDVLRQLTEARLWADQVHRTFASLDQEGRELLPMKIRKALLYASFTVTYIGRAIEDDCNGCTGIAAWSE